MPPLSEHQPHGQPSSFFQHIYINSHHISSPPCQIRATGVEASPSRAEEEKVKNNKFQKRHTTAAAISQQSAGGRVKRAAPLSVARGSTGWRRRSQTSPQTIGIDRSKRKERKTRKRTGAKRWEGKNKTKKEEEKGRNHHRLLIMIWLHMTSEPTWCVSASMILRRLGHARVARCYSSSMLVDDPAGLRSTEI